MAASRNEALARPRATYQDVLDAPAHQVAEIIDGTLYTHPRPAPPHTIAASFLGVELGAPFSKGRGGPGGWWILTEPELHLGDEVLVPDLAGWRRERMPDRPETAYFPLAPDWACEVLSASTRRTDLQHKRPVYARERVAHLWLIGPIDRDARGVRAPRWAVGPYRMRERRRTGQHTPVRRDLVQPGRAVVVTAHQFLRW